MDEPWLLDELAYAGPEHLDPDFVAGFDRKQGYPSFEEDLQVLRRHGALTEESTVVDLGTGTGRFALAASRWCRRVVAVDVSPAMLGEVADRASEAGATNIECVLAGFITYPHRGAPADAVYSRHALHQLPDFWKGIALHRIAGMLRPGGILRLHDLVYDFLPEQASTVLAGWLDAAALDPEAGYTAEDYVTHVRTEFSTYRWLLDPLLEATGFQILHTRVRHHLYAGYTCVRR